MKLKVLLFFCTLKIHTMQQSADNLDFFVETIKYGLVFYSDPDNISNQEEPCNWILTHNNDYLKKIEEEQQMFSEYCNSMIALKKIFHTHSTIKLFNIFNPLKNCIEHIKIAQKIACSNKKNAATIEPFLLLAKKSLAEFILYKTSYLEKTIAAILINEKPETFSLDTTHFALARALGNYLTIDKTGDEKNIANHEKIIKTYLLKSITTQTLNQWAIHIIAGVFQHCQKKTYTIAITPLECVDIRKNIPQIETSAAKMNIPLKITIVTGYMYPQDYAYLTITISEEKTLQCSIL